MTRSALRMSALLAGLALASPVPAQTAIDLPGDKVFPESVTGDGMGTAFVPSAMGGISRVSLATGEVSSWIAPGAFGSGSIFGVIADPAHKLLWACSNDLSAQGVVIEGAEKGTFVKAFDLASGEGRVSLKLPGERAFCNDLTVAPDGTVYVSDSNSSHILRWTPGGAALEDWYSDPALGDPANQQSGLDGIAVGPDGNLYVNNWRLNMLARLTIDKQGRPGKLTILTLSQPVLTPDAIRFVGGLRFALAEGGGRISLVTLNGDRAEVKPLAAGYVSAAGVTPDGGMLWHVPGLVSYIFNPQLRGQTPPLPFRLSPVALP